MGDYNIDLLKYHENVRIQQFINSLCSNFCLPIISRPTRITRSTASLLDNIITNQFDIPVTSGIIYSDVSDHLPIFQISSLKPSDGKSTKKNVSLRRVMSKENLNAFREELCLYNWCNVLKVDDPDNAYNRFLFVISTLYDKHFPLKKISSSKRILNPWMTSGIIQSVKHKNKLYKKFL